LLWITHGPSSALKRKFKGRDWNSLFDLFLSHFILIGWRHLVHIHPRNNNAAPFLIKVKHA
jgi:hypothetical protein